MIALKLVFADSLPYLAVGPFLCLLDIGFWQREEYFF
jgi:hypothetical protein